MAYAYGWRGAVMDGVRVVSEYCLRLPGCLAAGGDDGRLPLEAEARFPEVPRNVARHLPTPTAPLSNTKHHPRVAAYVSRC
jgi:hypothetical protein